MKINSKSLIFLAGMGLGLVGVYTLFNSNLEKKVAKLYEKERSKFEVNVNIQGVDSVYNFSREEKFQSDNPTGYYSTKQGFNYKAEDLVSIPSEAIDKMIGQKYSYSVETGLVLSKSPQRLAIDYYTNDIFPGSNAIICASEKDIINYLFISDRLNNTQLNIYRSSSGELEFENINKEGAIKLFDYYQTEFLNFKNQNKINEKLKEYSPKFELIKRNVYSQ